MVLGPDAGPFPAFVRPARFGLAVIPGSGRQWMPWIHIEDTVRLIITALDDPRMSGPLNAVAPDLRRAAEFTHATARAVNRPVFIRIPAALLKLVLGEMSGLLLFSAQVVPDRLHAAGFTFRFPDLDEALKDLVRSGHGRSSHGASSALTAWTATTKG
jgi:uncharacterized protein (TIGR01777 family)